MSFTDYFRRFAVFAVCVSACVFMSLSALADPGDEWAIGDKALPMTIKAPLHARRKSSAEKPKAKTGVQVDTYAKNLGQISAIDTGDKGEIYVLNQFNGTLSVLEDRELDGRMDMQRPLQSGFTQPSGLVLAGEHIYISDATAIWVMDRTGGTKRVLASLEKVQASPENRPLSLSPDGKWLYLGLSKADGTARIVRVNRQSGQAENLSAGPGPVRALAQAKGTPLWVAVNNSLIAVTTERYSLGEAHHMEPGVLVQGFYLPAEANAMPEIFNELTGQFLVLQGGGARLSGKSSGGQNLVAVPVSFGQPQNKMQVVIDGLVTNHGRTVWGEFSDIAWDARGLFLADRQNGIIWKASKAVDKPKILSPKEKPETKFQAASSVKKPKAKWGSSIAKASTITTGSTLSENWKEQSLMPEETLMEKLRREEEEALEESD